MNHTIGIADMAVSKSRDEVLVTYALGSCVGVTIYDPVVGVGGLIHCMLPLSKIDPVAARDNPYKFVDTGVPMLFHSAYRLGARKERIVVKVAGGAKMHDAEGRFRIGERNYAVLRKILWKNNVLIQSEDVGGTVSRTMSLEIATGRVLVKSKGTVKEL